MMRMESSFGIPGENIPCQEISDQVVFAQTPLVSVHMITYNHELHITQAIEGVLQQKTDFPYELIIGEDCSTDRTREIVFEYQKKYPTLIRVLVSEGNVGIHKNVRRVYDACRGKYIAYCEGDDFWHHPLKLKTQVEYMESHPDVGMIHSNGIRRISKTGESSPYFSSAILKNIVDYDLSDSISRLMLEYKYFVITCSVVTRKSLIEEIYRTCHYEFSAEHLSGDFQTWMELASRSKVKFLQESFVTYNVLEESAINTKDIQKKLEFLLYTLRIRSFHADKYWKNDATIKKIIVKRVSQSMSELGFFSHDPKIVELAFSIARENNVRLNFECYINYVGSLNLFLYYIIIMPSYLLYHLRRILS